MLKRDIKPFHFTRFRLFFLSFSCFNYDFFLFNKRSGLRIFTVYMFLFTLFFFRMKGNEAEKTVYFCEFVDTENNRLY